MAADDRTDRFRPVFEPEDILDRFVRNANSASSEVRAPRDDEQTGVVDTSSSIAVPREVRGGPPSWDHQITVRSDLPQTLEALRRQQHLEEPARDDEGTNPEVILPEGVVSEVDSGDVELDDDELDDAELDDAELDDAELDDDEEDMTQVRQGSPLTESGQRILLLTKVKKPSSPPPPMSAPIAPPKPPPSRAPAWDSVVIPRGQHTQKLEAIKLVPDVGAVAPKLEKPVRESSEDGQMPTRQLDQILSDMSVLLRYGHAGQVRERLEQLRRTYPEDLLLLRRIAEFHVEHGDTEAALETLFALAGGLFERRNVEGMRQALEQILVLDSENARAYRLLGLLEQRPQTAGD